MNTYCWFIALREEGGVRDRVVQVGPKEVGPQSFGGLVGHLDPILEDRHWEIWRGVTGQPQPEVGLGNVDVRNHLKSN